MIHAPLSVNMMCQLSTPASLPTGGRNWPLAFILLGCLLLAAVPAWGNEKVSFQAYTAEGKYVSGTLDKLGSGWDVQFQAPTTKTVAGKDLLSLRRAGSKLPAHPLTPQLVLSGGDRIPVDPAKGLQFLNSQFRVHPVPPLQTVQGTALQVPSSAVAMLWLQTPDGVASAEKFLRQLLQRQPTSDILLLQNGDQVEGIFIELDSDSACKIKVKNKIVQVPFDRVAALVFNSLFLLEQRPSQAYGHLVLANGCRLSLLSAELDAGKSKLIGQTPFKATMQVPLGEVIALDLYQGRAVYLADLKPARYEHRPFFGVAWPLVINANASGGPLRLGGESFDRGLGMHSASTVTYDLNGDFAWFEALVGLDDLNGKGGSARVRVLLDGKETKTAFEKELTWKDQPQTLRIPVHQARQLTLTADFADRGEVNGHVNWANARLIKK